MTKEELHILLQEGFKTSFIVNETVNDTINDMIKSRLKREIYYYRASE